MPALSIRSRLQSLRYLPQVARLCGRAVKGWHGWALWRRGVYVWRVFQYWPLHPGLLAFFEAHPVLRQVAQRWPRQLLKVYRHYPCQGYTVPEREQLLRRHHALLQPLLGPALYAQVMLQRDTLLCRIPLPKGQGSLAVRLLFAFQYDREGELSLVLDDPFGTPLYTLTFSLQDRPDLGGGQSGGLGILVGGLQGRLSVDTARHLTKLSLGLRPPALLVWALQGLARALGAQGIRAVGRSRHIYHGTKLGNRTQFDYDGFWASVGGQPDGAGWFNLPLVAPRRTPADMPSNKRAQYQRRYAWLDELDAELARALGQLLPPPHPPATLPMAIPHTA